MSVVTASSQMLGYNKRAGARRASDVTDWSRATAWVSGGTANYSAPAPGILVQHFGGTATVDGVSVSNITYGATLHLPYTTSCVINSGYAHGVQIDNPKARTLGGFAISNVTQTRIYQTTGAGGPGLNSTYTYNLPYPTIVESVGWLGSFQNNAQGGQSISDSITVILNGADTSYIDKVIYAISYNVTDATNGRSYYANIPIMIPCRGTLKINLSASGGTGNTPHYGTFTLVYNTL